MDLQRSSTPLHSEADVYAAATKVAQVVRALKLTEDEMTTMFTLDVLDNISAADIALKSFAKGYRIALGDTVRRAECEFVYRSARGAYFGLVVGVGALARAHIGKMTLAARRTCTVGWVWKDSDLPFTAFTAETALEGLA